MGQVVLSYFIWCSKRVYIGSEDDSAELIFICTYGDYLGKGNSIMDRN